MTSIGGPASEDGLGPDGGLLPIGDAKAGELVIVSEGGAVLSRKMRLAVEMIVDMDNENIQQFTVEATFNAVAGEASDLPEGLR